MIRDPYADDLAGIYPNYARHPEYLDGMTDAQVIENATETMSACCAYCARKRGL